MGIYGYGGNYLDNLSLTGEATGGYQDSLNLGNVDKALSIAGFEPGGKYTKVSAEPRAGAGFWGDIGKAAGGLGGGGGGGAPGGEAAAQRGYSTIAEDGEANRKAAMSKLGSAIGAIAGFYTGNWGGAISSASGLIGGQK